MFGKLEILLFFISVSFGWSYTIKDPPKCGPNEVFALCTYSNQPTCDNPKESGNLDCVGHCVCRRDYLKNDEGKCISREACLLPCPKNSVFEQCSTNYKQKCVKRKGDVNHRSCAPGCTCKPGYYWMEESNSCLKLKECLAAERAKTVPRLG